MITSIILISVAVVLLACATKIGLKRIAEKAGEIIYYGEIAKNKIGANFSRHALVPIGATVGYHSRRYGLRTGRAVKISPYGRVRIDLGGHTVRRQANRLKVLRTT